MADETKRVIDQTTDSSLSAGDYVIVDSESEGTRKFDLGTELTDIKQDLQELIDGGAGMTEDFKQALHNILEKVAFIDEDGQDYLDALDATMWPSASSISCVYTQSGTVYASDNIDSLKADLVVTALYSDSTTKVLKPSEYTLTGTLTEGTSTIAVHYGNLTTSFTVTVASRTVVSISAVYTQSGTIYSDDDIDSLKSDLVVTATYNDSSTAVLNDSDYSLSGTLDSITSTITVVCGSATTTFNVTVVLVGSTDYADALSNWFLTTTQTISYSDGKITMQTSQSNANAWNMYCVDRAKTLWDTVKGKKLRIRVTMESPNWVGDMSTTSPVNCVAIGVGIYKNATVTNMQASNRLKYGNKEVTALNAESQTFEIIFDCDVSNFDSGTGTPTSASTFGVYVYSATVNTTILTKCEVVEVITT